MENERLNYLLAYLDRLIRLNDGDFRCNTEICECMQAIAKELSLE